LHRLLEVRSVGHIERKQRIGVIVIVSHVPHLGAKFGEKK